MMNSTSSPPPSSSTTITMEDYCYPRDFIVSPFHHFVAIPTDQPLLRILEVCRVPSVGLRWCEPDNGPRGPCSYRDAAWCPLGDQGEEATFTVLTACRGAPLQLWDTDPKNSGEGAALRANYVARNGMDEVVSPRCVLWSKPLSSSTAVSTVFGGYSTEGTDTAHVREFDLLREGSDGVVRSYKSPLANGNCGTTVCRLFSVQSRWLAVSYFQRAAPTELWDPRRNGLACCLTYPAKQLQQGGGVGGPIVALKDHPTDSHTIMVGRRGGRLEEWDVRRCSTGPVASLSRRAATQQSFSFDWLPRAVVEQLFPSPSSTTKAAGGDAESHILVAADPQAGGSLLIFDGERGAESDAGLLLGRRSRTVRLPTGSLDEPIHQVASVAGGGGVLLGSGARQLRLRLREEDPEVMRKRSTPQKEDGVIFSDDEDDEVANAPSPQKGGTVTFLC